MNNMTPKENLHYAIGEIAYAIAKADGAVQKSERQKIHDMVAAEIRCGDNYYDLTDIGFQVLDKENMDTATTYQWAMNEIRLNSHYLSPELKKEFIHFIERIAKAYPPVTIEEQNLIEKFKSDIALIHGDPVYYEKKVM
jgi:uncharacterized tellurite resistance protein B-like protein